MDGDGFDDLARRLGVARSRRGVLKTLAVGSLASVASMVGARSASAGARRRSVGNACRVNADCASNLCVSQSRTRKICHCQSAADCPGANDACHSPVCQTDGTCAKVNAPVDCVVSDWGDFSACSAACGGGTQTRTRSIVTLASCGGQGCPATVETQPCNAQACSSVGSCDATQAAAFCSTVTAVDDTQFCGRPVFGPCCNTDADCANDGVTCTSLGPAFCAKLTQSGAAVPSALICAADQSKAGVCCCLEVCDIPT